MKKETIFKILKIFASVLLSAVLVLGVTAVPFYYSIIALTEPETVSVIIQEVDYKEVIRKNPAIKKTLAEYGISPADADTVMKSKKTGELVKVYADEVKQIFLDIPDSQMLDVSYIKEIVDKNTDKFIKITENNTQLKFEKKAVKKNIDTFFQENEVELQESIEVLEEVRDVIKTIYASRVIENKLSLWCAVIFIATAFAVIAVIVAFMRSNGFLWVAVDFAVINIILCLIIVFGKSAFVNTLAFKMSDFGTQIIESAISISLEKIIIALFSTMVMMALFMGFFLALKLLKYKYKNESTAVEKTE